jgi:hypothetical protein
LGILIYRGLSIFCIINFCWRFRQLLSSQETHILDLISTLPIFVIGGEPVYPHTIIGNLPSSAVVKTVVLKLKKAGFDISKLSVIGKNSPAPTARWRFLSWVKQPYSLGEGLFGILAGAGVLFIRGIGLVVIAGPIAGILGGWLRHTVAGEVSHPVMGGIVEALSLLGIAPAKALQLAEQIKAGKFLLLVAGSDRDISQVQYVLAEVNLNVEEVDGEDELPMAV